MKMSIEDLNNILTMLFEKSEDVTDYSVSYAGVDEIFLTEFKDYEWEDLGKFQTGYRILEFSSTGSVMSTDEVVYVMQEATRYGDYWSGYDYEYEKPYLVRKEKKIVEVEEWVEI